MDGQEDRWLVEVVGKARKERVVSLGETGRGMNV